MTMRRFENKSILVTGGSSGIGKATAERFAREGGRVLIFADRAEELRQTAEGFAREAQGLEVIACHGDVSIAADVDRAVQQALQAFGTIDVLVSNAGFAYYEPFLEIGEAHWDRLMAVNVKGVFLCTRAALPHLRTRGEAAIVNISSISGKTGRAFTAPYAASKFAVIGLTQALAQELGPANIRVNAVCPGLLRTTMWTDVVGPARAASLGVAPAEAFDVFVRQNTPLGREQTPADIGEAVVYLCRADNVTGVALNVAGGMEMH